MINIPFILTLYAGFTHAFETDHLLAVSNIVTNRNRTIKALKDGFYWGLGHSSTILIMGGLVLLMKFNIEASTFRFFEAIVGLLLIVLGSYRIIQWYRRKGSPTPQHIHKDGTTHNSSHLPAFLIGLVHGLAGSGALLLIVMGKSISVESGLVYLLLFGIGSVSGMILAAGTFSKKILASAGFQTLLIFISSLLCIIYGSLVVAENLF
jgi:hypothetical protein